MTGPERAAVDPRPLLPAVEAADAVVVMSTPRAGSTWFARILLDHPQLTVYSHARDQMWLMYFLYPGKLLNPFADDLVGDASGAAARLLAPLRRSVLHRVYRPSGSIRVFSSPTVVAFVPLLKQIFPKARFVHLRRDPIDVIASLQRFIDGTANATFWNQVERYRKMGLGPAGVLRSSLAQYFHRLRWLRSGQDGFIHLRPPGFFRGRHLGKLQYLCWYYCGLESWIDELVADVPVGRRFDASYDALVANPREELGRVLSFMGVGLDEDHVRRTTESVHVRSRPKRSDFSPEELQQLHRWLELYRGRSMVETEV